MRKIASANKAHLQPILMHMPTMTMVIVERRICHQVTSRDISSDLIQIVHIVKLYYKNMLICHLHLIHICSQIYQIADNRFSLLTCHRSQVCHLSSSPERCTAHCCTSTSPRHPPAQPEMEKVKRKDPQFSSVLLWSADKVLTKTPKDTIEKP